MATSRFADPSIRRAGALAAAYLLLALHGLGDHAIVGDDEAREVGIVQDVVRGRVLLPRFNDELIPDKPILTHWLSAAVVAVGGFSEAHVRLPSAVAGSALVGWTALFGDRLLGAPAGLAAGVLLATTPALFGRARLARPDVVMVLLLALALGAFWHAWREGDRRAAVVAWTWLGLATCAKGPVAPALAATTIGLFLLWQRDGRAVGRLLPLPGLVLFAVLGGGWYLAALTGWGEEFVRQHLVGRYVRNLAGGLSRGGAYSPNSFLYHLTFYPLHLPAILMPWTPLLAAASSALWRSGGLRDPRARFLVCWLAAPVVVFTPAEWKLRYYLLPALPAAALLAAPLAARLAAAIGRPPSITRRSLAAASALTVATIAAAVLVLGRPELLSAADRRGLEAVLAVAGGPAVAAAAVGILVGIVAVIVACRAWGVLVTVTAIATGVWLLTVAPALERATAARDDLRDFARAVAARVPAVQPLVFVGPPVRSVVVYVGRAIPSIPRHPERLPPEGWILARAAAHRALFEAGVVGPPVVEGSGRLGNLERGELVLAEIRARRPFPLTPGPPGA